MLSPPPVSGEAYSTAFASETQSNILRAGLAFSTAYSNNVQGTSNPVGDVSYSIWPTVAFNAKTTRMNWSLNYAPGYTFYQHTSSLNQGDQNVAVDFQYGLTPHLTVSLRNDFQKTNNPFNRPNPLTATSVSGSPPPPNVAVIAPIETYRYNAANVQLEYQFSADGMIGVSGTFTQLYYPNPTEASGLYNSTSSGGSVSYSRRFFTKYYLGASYQYQDISSYQASVRSNDTRTQTQTAFLFCSFYLKPTLSVSLSGGPQHYDATQSSQPASRSWSPMLMASIGWQGQRTSLAASYARIVTSGGGLIGAYHWNAGNLSARWQLSRTWSVGLATGYSTYSSLTPYFVGSNSGGHTMSVTASVHHPLGDHLMVEGGYTRLQQSYAEIPAVSAIPDINRVFLSISYQFTRPLKR
jgi:hypothetical protein